jgi:DNA-binding MarR family transcriptional regulator
MKVDGPEDLRSLLRRASRMAGRHYRAQLVRFDLSASQATALLFLNERDGSTLRDLADAISADLATASALVDRLMSQGLIVRETDPADRRRARLLLSEAATELLAPLAEATRETNAMLVNALGQKRSAELAAVLTELIDAVAEAAPAMKKDVGAA